jgi:hypothetical protein
MGFTHHRVAMRNNPNKVASRKRVRQLRDRGGNSAQQFVIANAGEKDAVAIWLELLIKPLLVLPGLLIEAGPTVEYFAWSARGRLEAATRDRDIDEETNSSTMGFGVGCKRFAGQFPSG